MPAPKKKLCPDDHDRKLIATAPSIENGSSPKILKPEANTSERGSMFGRAN